MLWNIVINDRDRPLLQNKYIKTSLIFKSNQALIWKLITQNKNLRSDLYEWYRAKPCKPHQHKCGAFPIPFWTVVSQTGYTCKPKWALGQVRWLCWRMLNDGCVRDAKYIVDSCFRCRSADFGPNPMETNSVVRKNFNDKTTGAEMCVPVCWW